MPNAEQVEVQGLIGSLEDACAEWPDNQTVHIGFIAKDWRLILAALRSPPQGGDQGAEAMREYIAKWHDWIADDRESRMRALGRHREGYIRLDQERMAHRDAARAVRSMSIPPAPPPSTQSSDTRGRDGC